MERKLHDLQQGTEAWHQFRFDHHGASEAAAMLGLSKKTSRSELLRMKHLGVAKEFSDWVQKNILDYGHEVEALALPFIEKLVGEPLYRAVMSYGTLGASCDGLTMMGDRAVEHKQWAAELAAAVSRGELPEEHQPQCQQVLFVTGADILYFVVSDGTPEKMVYMLVHPDEAWQKRIQAGWALFDEDLANYVHQEVIPAAVAAPQMALPAVTIQVNGSIALRDNLQVFGDALTAYVERINRKPETDQDFADLEAAVKTLGEAEKSLDAAENGALAQTESIDGMRRTVELYRKLARDTRLTIDKLVKSEKENRRAAILADGQKALAEHIKKLNARWDRPYMPIVQPEFQAVMKGLKKLDAMKDKVASEVARCKLIANDIADQIAANLKYLAEHGIGFEFLFSDLQQIVLKEHVDFATQVAFRISNHKAAKEKADAELREKIRVEEEAKAQAKAAADAAAVIEADRKAHQTAARPEPVAEVRDAPAPAVAAAHTATVSELPKRAEPVRPSDESIVCVVALNYGISVALALQWLTDLDIPAMREGMLEAIA